MWKRINNKHIYKENLYKDSKKKIWKNREVTVKTETLYW